jgi:prepilin-type N-terminal cleavage/methylation domain-containing protein
MPRRSGFTLIELLIAIALSTVVLGLAVNQLIEYFRLQQVLVTRTQLRQDAKGAMERIAKHMRYCPLFGQADQSYMGLVPLDENHDGVIGKGDRYELVQWKIVADPLANDRHILQERTITVPAFQPPDDYDALVPFFGVQLGGSGRRLASNVERVAISRQGPALVKVEMDVAQAIPKQKEPVTLHLTEMVGIRSDLIWNAADLPSIQDVLDTLKVAS